jgi:hypothetical protein
MAPRLQITQPNQTDLRVICESVKANPYIWLMNLLATEYSIKKLVGLLRLRNFKGNRLGLHATAIPLLSAAGGNPLHFKMKAIHAIGDPFWADIFPKGEDFSVASEAPSYTNLHALDTAATKK